MWTDIILYTFLSYLTLHLIIDDICLMVRLIKNNQTAHSEFNGSNHLNNTEQRTMIVIINKICDIVLACVLQYFKTFEVCWTTILECLQILIIKYIDFLTNLVKSFLEYPACLYASITTIISLSIATIMLWLILN